MKSSINIPFEATHPGILIRDELELCPDLSQKDLAVLLGVKPSFLNEIIKGKRPLTADLAILLEKALHIPADYWLRFQLQYELDLARLKEKSLQKLKLIEEWRILNQYVPTKYFSKERLLTNNLELNLAKILEIYEVDSVAALQQKILDLERAIELDAQTLNQIAWIMHAKYKAFFKQVCPYNIDKLPKLMTELAEIADFRPLNVLASADTLLSNYGVKLIEMESSIKFFKNAHAFLSDGHLTIAVNLNNAKPNSVPLVILKELLRVNVEGKESKTLDWIEMLKPDSQQMETCMAEMIGVVSTPKSIAADIEGKYRTKLKRTNKF